MWKIFVLGDDNLELEEQEAKVTIMALICHAVLSACGKILTVYDDSNVSKTLENKMGHVYVCGI